MTLRPTSLSPALLLCLLAAGCQQAPRSRADAVTQTACRAEVDRVHEIDQVHDSDQVHEIDHPEQKDTP